MDFEKEYNLAKKRIIELERENAKWQKNALDYLPPEELAHDILGQQVETLTFHLLQSQKVIDDLKKQLVEKTNQLKENFLIVQNIRTQLETKEEIIVKLNDLLNVSGLNTSPKPSFSKQSKSSQTPDVSGQRAGAAALVSEDEVRDLIGIHVKTEAVTKNQTKTIADFIHLLRRIKRVKLLDASILLDVPPKLIDFWAEKLKSKGFVSVEGIDRDKKMIFANPKITNAK